MADVNDDIAAIYELLPSKEKKSLTEKDFVTDFKGKIKGYMQDHKIPFTNKSFSKAVSIVRKNAETQGINSTDSIEEVITSAIYVLTNDENNVLKKNNHEETKSAIQDVAEVAMTAMIANELAKNFDKLSDKDKDKVIDHMEELDEESMSTMIGSLQKSIDKNKLLSLKTKDFAKDAIEFITLGRKKESK